YAWQMALGVLSNVLIWWIARRHFGERAGLIAALLALLCGPLVFYEWTLVRTSLTVFFSLGLVFMFERALDRESKWRWAATGAALGLALLLQTVFLLFGLAAAAWLAWRSKDRWRAAAAMSVAAFACLVPAFVRNAVVGAPLFGLSSVGTVTFAAANWPDSDPTRGWAVDDRAMARLMHDSGGDFGRAARAVLDQHDPATFAQLMIRKFKMLAHDYELPNNKNFLYYRAHSPVLYLGFVGFGVILPFALVGLYAAWKEAGRHALLFALVGSSAAPMLIFYVLARFRAPMTAALIPFAALGIVFLADELLAKRWKRAGIAGGVVLLAALCLFRPLPDHMRAIRSADYRISFKTYGAPREQAAVEASNWPAAVSTLAEALEDEPKEVRDMDGTPLPEGGFEIRQITDFFRAVHARRADYLVKLGRTEEARKDADRAEVLHRSLGGVPSAEWKP
ncbi:MAG TPA: glycosyltransferase family 39 protein, partial [Planctomycetota bacterium]|nr:glycosyltransferase family 39 protein [Planctomycetota bacterium]